MGFWGHLADKQCLSKVAADDDTSSKHQECADDCRILYDHSIEQTSAADNEREAGVMISW